MQENVDFEWVPVKSGDGSVVTDGKGNPVLTRRFFTKAEKKQRTANSKVSAPATTTAVVNESKVTPEYRDDEKGLRTKGPYGNTLSVYADDAKTERTRGPNRTTYMDDAKAQRTKGPYSTAVYKDDRKASRTNAPKAPLVTDVAALIQQLPSQASKPQVSAFALPGVVGPPTSSFLSNDAMVSDGLPEIYTNYPMIDLQRALRGLGSK
jgi:hypothetical protein